MERLVHYSHYKINNLDLTSWIQDWRQWIVVTRLFSCSIHRSTSLFFFAYSSFNFCYWSYSLFNCPFRLQFTIQFW